MAGRVAMIGLDAAEWWLVEKYIEEGVMPHLDKLMSSSKFTRLTADKPFKAEGRWTEILTGRSADENQYWSIVDFDPQTYTPWYSRSCHGTYFYARPDLKAIVFDVPNSIIAEDVHGVQITAWGAHAAQFPSASKPARVLADIDRKFGVHEGMLSDGHAGWHNEQYLDQLQATMVKGISQRVSISEWLCEQEPDWNLFFTVFPESHVGEHQFLHGVVEDHPLHDRALASRAGEKLRTLFADMDTAIGEMTAKFDESTSVVVFAAHGMESNKSDVLAGVLIPEFLHRLRFGSPLIDFEPWTPGDPYLTLDERSLPRHYLESRLRQPTPVTSSGVRSWPKRLVRRVRHHLPETALNTFEKTYWGWPDWWNMRVREPVPYHSRDLYTEAARIELESVAAASWYRPFWSSMDCFVIPSFSDCHLRLNVRGREQNGTIEPDDYAAACDEVEAQLRSLTDPRKGVPIVDEVLRIRSADPMAEIGPAPDLVVTFHHVTDIVEHPSVGLIGPAPLMRMGEHRPEGWAMIRTPDGKSEDLGSMAPKDLTATVLNLIGAEHSPLVTGSSRVDSD